MKKAFIPLAILMVVILLVSACSKTSTTSTTTTSKTTTATSTPTTTTTSKTTTTTTSSTPTSTVTTPAVKTGGTLRIIYQYSPASTPGWPHDTTNPQVMWAFWVTFETLVKLDAAGQPIPWLSTDWKWGPENAYIDFNLRNDVSFSDGTKFTADTVVTDINQLFTDKNSITTDWDRIEKTGDYSVRLYLKTYLRSFWGNIGATYYASDTQLREKGMDYVKEHPVGTGPFLFKSFEKDVSMKFVKNTNYWQAGKPYLDGIDFITTKEELTQQAKMESNEGDVLTLKSGQILQTLRNEGFNVIAQAGSAAFLMFDTANEGASTNDPKVRQAIEYAINKQEMADVLGFGGMFPSNQIHMIGNPGYDPDLPSRDYDPDKAKALLAEAGYTSGLTLTLISENSGQDTAVMLQQYMAAVGITLKLEMVDNAKLWDYIFNGWHGIISTAYMAGTSVANFIRTYFPPVSPLDISVKIPDDITQKCADAMKETDDAKYTQMSKEISQWIYDNAFFVPTVGVSMGYILRQEVKDSDMLVKFTSFLYWSPENCWLDR
jgi:peptide/nickel transport system substrate-binding protein